MKHLNTGSSWSLQLGVHLQLLPRCLRKRFSTILSF